MVSLNDLDGGKDYVRQKIADYFNDLVNIGVSGFRVDASKHMWPGDLEAIQVRDVDNFPHFLTTPSPMSSVFVHFLWARP